MAPDTRRELVTDVHYLQSNAPDICMLPLIGKPAGIIRERQEHQRRVDTNRGRVGWQSVGRAEPLQEEFWSLLEMRL